MGRRVHGGFSAQQGKVLSPTALKITQGKSIPIRQAPKAILQNIKTVMDTRGVNKIGIVTRAQVDRFLAIRKQQDVTGQIQTQRRLSGIARSERLEAEARQASKKIDVDKIKADTETRTRVRETLIREGKDPKKLQRATPRLNIERVTTNPEQRAQARLQVGIPVSREPVIITGAGTSSPATFRPLVPTGTPDVPIRDPTAIRQVSKSKVSPVTFQFVEPRTAQVPRDVLSQGQKILADASRGITQKTGLFGGSLKGTIKKLSTREITREERIKTFQEPENLLLQVRQGVLNPVQSLSNIGELSIKLAKGEKLEPNIPSKTSFGDFISAGATAIENKILFPNVPLSVNVQAQFDKFAKAQVKKAKERPVQLIAEGISETALLGATGLVSGAIVGARVTAKVAPKVISSVAPKGVKLERVLRPTNPFRERVPRDVFEFDTATPSAFKTTTVRLGKAPSKKIDTRFQATKKALGSGATKFLTRGGRGSGITGRPPKPPAPPEVKTGKGTQLLITKKIIKSIKPQKVRTLLAKKVTITKTDIGKSLTKTVQKQEKEILFSKPRNLKKKLAPASGVALATETILRTPQKSASGLRFDIKPKLTQPQKDRLGLVFRQPQPQKQKEKAVTILRTPQKQASALRQPEPEKTKTPFVFRFPEPQKSALLFPEPRQPPPQRPPPPLFFVRPPRAFLETFRGDKQDPTRKIFFTTAIDTTRPRRTLEGDFLTVSIGRPRDIFKRLDKRQKAVDDILFGRKKTKKTKKAKKNKKKGKR